MPEADETRAMRSLTEREQAILALLLEKDFAGRDELVVQARSVRTAGLSCNCGCPSFSLRPDQSLPPAPVETRMPSDAHGTDPGNNQIGVLLFVKDGYLENVEVYSYDGNFAGLPDPSALKLSMWSSPGSSGIRHLLNP